MTRKIEPKEVSCPSCNGAGRVESLATNTIACMLTCGLSLLLDQDESVCKKCNGLGYIYVKPKIYD